MSNVGGYAVSRDHLYSLCYHPPVRRHHQHREGVNRTESRVDHADGRGGWAFQEGEELRAPLSGRPSSSAATGESCLTNLDRLIEAVTPSVGAHNFDEVIDWITYRIRIMSQALRGVLHCCETRRLRTPKGDSCPYYFLEDLWKSFRERSAYGIGVPLLLNHGECVKQYYVPSLSGIQLYIDPVRLRVFHYVEQEQPHHRKPFYGKIWNLASQFPDLKRYRSCDILPTSWISVARYPIYRIPVGPTLQNLDASFLTFHCLSTHSRSISEPHLCVSNGRKINGTVSPPKFSVPFFGLASYKLRSSILAPSGTNECQRAANLLQAAGDWLQ